MKIELTTAEIETAKAKYEAGGNLSNITGACASMRKAMRSALIGAGCTMRTVNGGPRLGLSPAQLEQLIQLRERGLNWTEIGEVFGVSSASAKAAYMAEQLRRAGITI